MRRPFSSLLLTFVVLAGCGGPGGNLAHGGSLAGAPPAVTDENVHEVERTFWRMDPEDPARLAWRDALVVYRSGRSSAILARGDYGAIVLHLASLSELLTPADIEAARVPDELAPLAHWVVEHGAPRGDEGRVMGALVVLAAIEADGAERDRSAHRAERDQIAEWGRNARARIDNPIERYGDLIQVWEQYEQLAPAPEVLTTLARLYIEQRDALAAAFGPEGQGSRTAGRLSLQELRLAPLLVQRAPLDVAAVYLRHGDLERAIEHVRRMGGQSDMERDLVRILESAQRNDDAGANALDELARGFARARPNIGAAICRLAARRFPQDVRFPVCLARVAIEEDEPAQATAWYAEAVRVAPTDRAVYDEALERLGQMMEEGRLVSSAPQSRAVARQALEILDERTRRWPDASSPLTRESLLLSSARAEMAHGAVRQARERLLASLDARETREAHEELGLLLERVGEWREAAVHYRRALDMVEGDGPEGIADRAENLEHLGDTFRQSGDPRQAERMYRQALELWNGLVPEVGGPRAAVVQVRRGVLFSRLDDVPRAEEAFSAALDASPSWRDPYAAILAHLVTARPNLELAQHVLRRAQFQITLEPEWKVYFALWVQTIARRAAEEPERDVANLFEDGARGDSWSARLASFGHGELDFEGLLGAASTPGERTEAQFYQGARLLAAGDAEGARALFRDVLESGLVGFYEYAMAQELLSAMPASGRAESAVARP